VHASISMKSVSAIAVTAALGFTLMSHVGASPVQAQGFWDPYGFGGSQAARARLLVNRARVPRRDGDRLNRTKQSAEEVQASKAVASGPLLAVVSLSTQRMTVYDATGAIIRSPISSGKQGHRTPTGVFSVLQKNRHHVSNIYSGAPMPYMQRLTWSGIALHAGVLPGYPASAGCIRLPYPVAAKLFAMSKMGMRVVVAPSEPSASVFEHPALPEPLMIAAPVIPTPANSPARADGLTPIRVATVDGQQATASSEPPVATRFLNPMQAAQLERSQSKQRIADAVRANKQLLEDSQRISAEANAASGQLRVAQAHLDALKMRLDQTSVAEARAALETQMAEAARTLEAARANEADKSKAAFAAAVASRDAEEAVEKAEAAAKIAERGTEPIAVFISRREGKVFVRQGMVPLFEAPVTFKEPNRPLGTHVFQVMGAATASGRLTWKTVTVPENIAFSESALDRTSAADYRPPVRRERLPAVGNPSDARGALERVEMSADVRKRISERLWINGSITIADHGISNETGKGTDFVVLTQ